MVAGDAIESTVFEKELLAKLGPPTAKPQSARHYLMISYANI